MHRHLPKNKDFAVRYFAMLLIGLFIGSLGAVVGMSALQQETHYSNAVMAFMKHQMDALHGMYKSEECDAGEAARRIALVGTAASEIDAAFLPVGDDDNFRDLSDKLRQGIAAAQLTQVTDCSILKQTAGDIGKHCKACHDTFR